MVSSYGIDGVEANDVYMAIRVKMLSDRRNLNAMRVTAAFIEKVIADRAQYIGTPLVVDRHRLESGQYGRLTHLQDDRTGDFATEQVGSFINFEAMQEQDGETVLVGTARIEKRFSRVCEAVQELYERDQLCVSYEIMASSYMQTPAETIIDAAEGNCLIGMCIVSVPAYEDARALALVASRESSETELNEKEEVMNEEKMTSTAEEETKPPEVPEATVREETPTQPEVPVVPLQTTAEAVQTPDPELAKLHQEVSALKAANEQLTQFKEKWEAAEKIRLQAQQEERKRCLSDLVSAVGLKPEEHQESIDGLDYPTLAPMLLQALKTQQPTAPMALPLTAAANGLVQSGGIPMSGSQQDHPYRKLVKELTL